MKKKLKDNPIVPRRILIFAGFYTPVVGGYIKIIHELAQKFVDFGYTVDIVTSNTTNAIQYEVLDGINIHRLSSWNFVHDAYPIPKIGHSNITSLLKLRKNNYQFIITNTRFYPISFIGWLLSRFWRIPLIHLEHGSCHTVSDNPIISFIGKCYDHTLGSILVRNANINFGVSIPAVAFLNHLGAKNAKVMHNGIDIAQFDTAKAINDIKCSDSIVITYVGRLVYAKGVQDLLSVFPHLKGNIQIFIVGDGPYKDELKGISDEFNFSNITFLGEQKPENIPEILLNTDVFVNPSYSEGLPTSVLEACAAGCAVVATDVGGTNEIICDGSTGFLVQPGNLQELTDKLNILIDNKEIRDTFGEKARAYIKDNYSWDQIIEQWINEIKHFEKALQYNQNKQTDLDQLDERLVK